MGGGSTFLSTVLEKVNTSLYTAWVLEKVNTSLYTVYSLTKQTSTTHMAQHLPACEHSTPQLLVCCNTPWPAVVCTLCCLMSDRYGTECVRCREGAHVTTSLTMTFNIAQEQQPQHPDAMWRAAQRGTGLY